MADAKSIGAAIDELIAALEPLEGAARLTAIRAACDHLSIPLQGGPALGGPLINFSSGEPSASDVRAAGQVDIRTFKQQKAPSSANEMACVLAYYLQHLAPADQRKSTISAADVDKYFNQAGFPLPRRSDQLLVNARAAGYFESAGRGAYKLNAVGHNLVAHSLPRSAGESSRPASPRRSTRARTKRSRKRVDKKR